MQKFRGVCKYWCNNFYYALPASFHWMEWKGIMIDLILAAAIANWQGDDVGEWIGIFILTALAIFGLVWLFWGFIISPYQKDSEKASRIKNFMELLDVNILLIPRSRRYKQYASIEVINNSSSYSIFCTPSIQKIIWLKEVPFGEESARINEVDVTKEIKEKAFNSPFTWDGGGSTDMEIRPLGSEFVNVARFTDDLKLIFTFETEVRNAPGNYKIWINIKYTEHNTQKSKYHIGKWAGCMNVTELPHPSPSNKNPYGLKIRSAIMPNTENNKDDEKKPSLTREGFFKILRKVTKPKQSDQKKKESLD